MLIVYLEKLSDFAKNHANARKSLAIWKMVTEKAAWKNKQDVLSDFPNAKMIKNNRARFEIVHNTYRLNRTYYIMRISLSKYDLLAHIMNMTE